VTTTHHKHLADTIASLAAILPTLRTSNPDAFDSLVRAICALEAARLSIRSKLPAHPE
jgi:predicted ATPase